MTGLLTSLLMLVMTLSVANRLAAGPDRVWILRLMAIAWALCFPLQVVWNSLFPFTLGGDDESYYWLAGLPIYSMEDMFDMTRFKGKMEQPGYPSILNILFQITGDDLLALKQINLACFLLLLPVWYRIGVLLQGNPFGRKLAIALLFTTPLWYYWVYLLKDIVITLFQSVFLLGLMSFQQQGGRQGLFSMAWSSLAVMLFRSQLAVLNVSLLLASLVLLSLRPSHRAIGKGRLLSLAGGGVMAILLLQVASNAEWMATLGIASKGRVLGQSEYTDLVSQHLEQSQVSKVMFPLLYLVSEVQGLKPESWADFDHATLRGLLAVPWILMGIPFFLLGCFWLVRPAPVLVGPRQGFLRKLRYTPIINGTWGPIVLMVLAYAGISWVSGDTTRWRLASFPSMMAISLLGWEYLHNRRRKIIAVWLLAGGVGFIAYYLPRQL